MDNLSLFDKGLKYQENFKSYIQNYINTYGFPCVYLTQSTETGKLNDFQLAFGGDKVGYDTTSSYYRRLNAKILVDFNNYSKLSIGVDTTIQAFVPDLESFHTGDRVEIQSNGIKLLYGIENAEKFNDIMYRFDLKFISKSNLK
jgi:hypothetical protein